MQISRDAETLGLLFKALAHYRCSTVADLAQRLGVAVGPPLLAAAGIEDDTQARWAEVADLSVALQLRLARPGEAAAPPPAPATPSAAEISAAEFAPLAVEQEPATALRTLREAVGLTAPQLAAKVGVPIGTVGDWERGTAAPEARQLGQLAQALGVAPEAVRAALPAPGGAAAGR